MGTNKLNNKGFTLIELLAVIVILAILMLLATPSVLSIMNNAKKSAVKTEVQSMLKAAQTKYAEEAIAKNYAEMHFKNGTSGDCSESSPCALEIEGGSLTTYDIHVKSEENTIKYKFNMSGGGNTASTNDTYVLYSAAQDYVK